LQIGSTREPDRPERRTCPLFSLRWFGWFIGVLLIGSLITLFASIGFPFLKINQFLLSSNSYNIFQTIEAVFSQHQHVVAVMLAIFLILFPTVRVLATIFLWFSACSLGRRLYWIRKVNIIARWSMIDVFGLSLVLIILEGHDLIRTDVKAGTFVLVLAIILTVVLPFLAMQIDPVKRLNDDEDGT
jgi:paraquat-inducible protein A